MALRLLAGGALAALIIAPVGDAALCIRLSTLPGRPIVGKVATVEMKTFVPLVDGGLRPQVVSNYPFRVQAVSPGGKVFRIATRPSRNPYAWRGSFRFPTAGAWTVRVRNFGPRYQDGCGAELHVRVRVRG